MSESKVCLWLAMPPTALLSLASLLTYLAFRLKYLATARGVTESPDDEDATNIGLRTLALPWIFFGLEMVILCMSTLVQSRILHYRYTANIYSTQCDSIPSSNPDHQACSPRETTLGRRRCSERGRTHHDLQRGRASCDGYCQGGVRSRLPSGSVSSLCLRRWRFCATTKCS